jgi:hypothetical protein
MATSTTVEMRHIDDDRSGGRRDRKSDTRVRFAQHARPQTSGVVVRRFTSGTPPPAPHHPLDLFAIAPPGSTVSL